MSDFYGGLGGALMLSNQLANDRLLDALSEARDDRNYAALLARHNDLVRRWNEQCAKVDELCAKVDTRVAEDRERLTRQKGRIGELKAENAELKERNASLERNAAEMKTELDYERSMKESYARRLYPGDFDFL